MAVIKGSVEADYGGLSLVKIATGVVSSSTKLKTTNKMSTAFEKKNTGNEGEEGIMDIGQHCTICRQLDFLPFVCPRCDKSYCNNHRIEYNTHECMMDEQAMKLKKLEHSKVDVSKLPKSKDLFPDLDKIRREAKEKYEMEQSRKIGNRLTNVRNGDNKPLTSIEVAMLRLKKLLSNSDVKKASTKSFLGFKAKISASSASKKPTAASKMLEMTQLKRSAKGDARITATDRVYVWVSYNSDDDTQFNGKHAQFFSKKWPIGKMLDSSADLAKVKNLNNKVVDSALKLAMFRKMRDGEKLTEAASEGFVYIPTSGRVEKEIKDGDDVYILRGQR